MMTFLATAFRMTMPTPNLEPQKTGEIRIQKDELPAAMIKRRTTLGSVLGDGTFLDLAHSVSTDDCLTRDVTRQERLVMMT